MNSETKPVGGSVKVGHTPTPWHIDKSRRKGCIYSNSLPPAVPYWPFDPFVADASTEENAEFIVRACNCIGPHLDKLDDLIHKTGLSEVDLIGKILAAEVNRLNKLLEAA